MQLISCIDFAYRTAAAAVEGKIPEEGAETVTTTSSTRSHPQSTATTPSGSPPLHPEATTTSGSLTNSGSREHGNCVLATDNTKKNIPKIEVSSHPPPTSFSRPIQPKRPGGATRKVSKSGGIQMVLDEAGSWSGLSDQSSTLPADSLEGAGAKDGKGGSSGMLGFLSRKKGRDKSPKPQEPGILGKEGARRIIN